VDRHELAEVPEITSGYAISESGVSWQGRF
jgi:hypothetical protein